MFIMHMPESFKVGDTATCVVDGEATQLTWRGPDTLVIGAADTRPILAMHVEPGLRTFVCGDADNSQYGVDVVRGEGFIAFLKSKEGAS
jgi:hypothetical protein